MKNILVGLMLLATWGCHERSDSQELPLESVVSVYLTTEDGASKFTLQDKGVSSLNYESLVSIIIDKSVQYQEVDGFGFALTGGSVSHLSQMSTIAKDNLLQELFGTEEGEIGLSYIRISIGASDLDATPYSYNDLKPGEVDIDQKNFSIEREKEALIPMLKEILEINPELKIMATPWSPPTWMKTNGSTIGGHLKEEYYDSYALYLVKYFQEMRNAGITIETMTIQNEPLHPGNNPSMSMLPEEQANFIKRSLGPAFIENNIQTKIILYDHNADRPDYPISILNDEEVRKYVAGSAFHMYAGDAKALSQVHDAHPDKGLYFTEQWFGAPGDFAEDFKWHLRELMIGATRNWSRNVIEWNLSSAPHLQPHTDGGCTHCLGGITIDGSDVIRNAGYYSVAHGSKWVRPGSVRVASSDLDQLPNVVFVTKEGRTVMMVMNDTNVVQLFNVTDGEIAFSTALSAGAVATIVW